jgi:hypothetical protein
MPSTLVGFFPGTSPFSPPRRGLQAQWLWRPGSPSEQRLPAYSQPSLEVDLTLKLVDFFPHPRHDGGDSARCRLPAASHPH